MYLKQYSSFYMLILNKAGVVHVMVVFVLWLMVVLLLNAGIGILAVVLIVGVLLGVISAIIDLL